MATTATAAEVFQSVGVELMIFAVTLAIAIAVRCTSASRQKRKGVRLEQSPRPPAKYPSEVIERVVHCAGVPRNQRGPRHHPHAWMLDEAVNCRRDRTSMGSAYKALSIFADVKALQGVKIKEMALATKHSPLDFYTSLVQCAIRVGKHPLVEEIMDHMAEQGVDRTLFFYESAMKQLAGKKYHKVALSIYDRLAADGLEPSAVTYSCLISFAMEVGELQRAIDFFEKLSAVASPSIRAYMTVLRVHGRRQDWSSSLAIFRDMQSRQAQIDSLVLNMILATGVATDEMDAVEALLTEAEEMTPPICDQVSYNTLIKGYSQRNDSAQVTRAVSRMLEQGIQPNAITFNTAMDAAVRSGDQKAAWNLLREMRQAGFRPDKFTCSILVKVLAKEATPESFERCLQLLSEVNFSRDAGEKELQRTLYHNVLEAAVSQVPDTSLMILILAQMRNNNVPTTSTAQRLLINEFTKQGDVSNLTQAWQQMLKEKDRPQANIFVALLDGYLKLGHFEGALSAFESLRSSVQSDTDCQRRHADGVAFLEECRIAFICNLCKISREAEASHLYLQAKRDGEGANVVNATATMLARLQTESGNLKHACATLEDLLDAGRPIEAALQIFLGACTKHAHTFFVKVLVQKCAARKIALSQTTYQNILKVYGRCRQVQDALEVFKDMTEVQGIQPSPQTAASLLRICFQCRCHDEALAVFGQLQAKNMPAPLNGSIYWVVLGGCASAGLVSKGLAIAEEALKLGAALPSDALETLVAASTRRGSACELERLRELAAAHGLSVKPRRPESEPALDA